MARTLLLSALVVAACAPAAEEAAPVVAEATPVAPAPVLSPPVDLTPEPTPADDVLSDLGLVRPVAVVHDPASDVYLISNAPSGGAPGFITSLLPDGAVDALRWIDGAERGVVLNRPAGMALVQTRLVVADGDHLRIFDRETGVPRGEVFIPGATSLRDVATGPRGAVYVTDAGKGHGASPGAVWRVSRRGTVSLVAKSSVLGRPEGLVCVGSTVWIAATAPKAFYGIDPAGTLTHGPSLPGAVTGVAQAEGHVFFSSPVGRSIYGGPLAGPFVPVVAGVDGPGDVGWDAARRRLLVPRVEAGALGIYTLAPSATGGVTTTAAPTPDPKRG